MRPRFRTITVIALTVPLTVYLTVGGGLATSVAVAGDLIGSSDIANGSIRGADVQNGTIGGGDIRNDSLRSVDIKDNRIRSRDIHDGTITGTDVKDGSLTAADLAPGVGGTQGPKGDKGDKGDPGEVAPSETYNESTWNVDFHNGNGATSFTADSTTQLADGTALRVTSASVTGDFSGCYAGGVSVKAGGTTLEDRQIGGSGTVSLPVGNSDVFVTGAAHPLTVSASCPIDMDGDYGPVPDFTLTLHFLWKPPAPTKPVDFN